VPGLFLVSTVIVFILTVFVSKPPSLLSLKRHARHLLFSFLQAIKPPTALPNPAQCFAQQAFKRADYFDSNTLTGSITLQHVAGELTR
jgi:hypothetical protein